MKNRITRRCAIALAFATLAGGAFAQAWPAKPVTLVVPFPPGGTTDVLARAIGQKLGDALGQPLVFNTRSAEAFGVLATARGLHDVAVERLRERAEAAARR